MNRQNCSHLFATDQLFQRTPTGTCDSSIIVFAALYPVLLIIRLTAAISRCQRFYSRRKGGKTQKNSPILPLLSLVYVLTKIVFFLLVIQNVVNVFDGWTFSIFSLVFLFFAATYFLELLRIVRLGTRIGSYNDSISNHSLEAFDRIGLLLVILSVTSAIAISVLLVILSPIFPEHDILFGVIGFASKGLFLCFVTFGLLWQIQRCYGVISSKMPDSQRKANALQRLRQAQINYRLFGFLSALFFFLLASEIFPWYWYVVLGVTGVPEALSQVVLECKMRKMVKPSSSSHTDGTKGFQKNVEPTSSSNNHNRTASEEFNRRLSLGMRKKMKKAKFRLNLSRVTEVSENHSIQSDAQLNLFENSNIPTISE